MTDVAGDSGRAVEMRDALVDALLGDGTIVSPEVARAFRAVPRHLFAVDEPLELAYDPNTALVIKRDEEGLALSSLSAAHIQAVMLEQAAVEPGMRVLEVGSGGYNAALLADLVGPTGAVTTVDIDHEITDRARECLDRGGYDQVRVVQADAEHGVLHGAPYDRIIVTMGAFDVPPAWREQLSPGGRIVVPLRWRGITRSVAFDKISGEGERADVADGSDGVLESRSYRLCGFVPAQGQGAHRELIVAIEDGLFLRVDDRTEQFDADALRAAARMEPTEVGSGAIYDLPDELELFLLTSSPRMVVLTADQALVDEGRFNASAGRGVPALIGEDSFAYRIRRSGPDGGLESAVLAYGPRGGQLADRYCDLLRTWATRYRHRDVACIRYLPAGSPAATEVEADGETARSLRTVKPHGVVETMWP